jgi:hypothetical protein
MKHNPNNPVMNLPIVTTGYTRCFSVDAHGAFNHVIRRLPANISIVSNAPIGLGVCSTSDTPHHLHKNTIKEVFDEVKSTNRDRNSFKVQYGPTHDYFDAVVKFYDRATPFISGVFERPRSVRDMSPAAAAAAPYLGRFIITHRVSSLLGGLFTSDPLTRTRIANNVDNIRQIIDRESFIPIDYYRKYKLSEIITEISKRLNPQDMAIVVLNICNGIDDVLPQGYSSAGPTTRGSNARYGNDELTSMAMKEIRRKTAELNETVHEAVPVCDRIMAYLGLCTAKKSNPRQYSQHSQHSQQNLSEIEIACRDAASIPPTQRTHTINNFIRDHCTIGTLAPPNGAPSIGIAHATNRITKGEGGGRKKRTRRNKMGIARRRYRIRRSTHRARLI